MQKIERKMLNIFTCWHLVTSHHLSLFLLRCYFHVTDASLSGSHVYMEAAQLQWSSYSFCYPGAIPGFLLPFHPNIINVSHPQQRVVPTAQPREGNIKCFPGRTAAHTSLLHHQVTVSSPFDLYVILPLVHVTSHWPFISVNSF